MNEKINYRKSDWHGFERLDFQFENRNCVLVKPKSADKKMRWLLKTEYFGAFPDFEIEMLKRGMHIAYIANVTRWHKSADDDAKAKLCEFLYENFGLNRRCLPVGMSCGGMQAVYFAAKYPQYVAALYLDAPVMNLLSCPCGIGSAGKDMYDEFMRDTGFNISRLINYRNHPIDRVDELIENRIPVFLVCGDSDTVVPYSENGYYLAEKYEKTDIPFKKIIKSGCNHHPHGLTDNSELIKFAEDNY